jgi:hypothetical protein
MNSLLAVMARRGEHRLLLGRCVSSSEDDQLKVIFKHKSFQLIRL